MAADDAEKLQKFVVEYYGEYCLRQMAISAGWVSDTLRLGEMLVTDNLASYDSDLFFIRLGAVIFELPMVLKHQFLQSEAIQMLDATGVHEPMNKEFVILSDRAFKAEQDLMSHFDEADLRILKFLRDRSSHLILQGFMITIGKNGELVIDDGNGTEKPQKRQEVLKLIAKKGGPKNFGVDKFKRSRPALQEFQYLLKRQHERNNERFGHMYTPPGSPWKD